MKLKRNMTTLIIVLVVFACIVWLDLWWQTPHRETTFCMHYQRLDGEYVRLVTIRGREPIANLPHVLVRQPDDITNEKVWFTDLKGRALEAPEELPPSPSGRMWWVTVNPVK